MLKRIAWIALLFSVTQVYGFQDYDIDGVEDSIDRCANTSFDAIVDKHGCAIDKNKKDYFGKFTLQVGTQIRQDDVYGSHNTLNLSANYRYKNWDMTLTNIQSTTMGSFSDNNLNDDGDIYLSAGYMFVFSKASLKLTVGTRFLSDMSTQSSSTNPSRGGRGRGKKGNHTVTATTDTISLDNDYFTSLNYSYQMNAKQNLFLFTGYTVTDDSPTQTYENYGSFSIGTGYSVTREFYTSVAYNYVGSTYADGEAEQSVSIFGNYHFNKNLFASATYRYAIDELSYDHTLLLSVGIVF
ncbi:MAG: hypothetical protein L3J43_03195 [Sulfurovum sp.]|nr:hypothetical protein [Sulfurovum sp.]